ncbi:Tfp pilus assembly protein FimT/FimU [Thermodesulfobacteriota bacterium]
MKIKIPRNSRGFTIVEIIVVLLLISIIAAAAFQRSITTDQMNLVSQFDKIQTQIRYPQSMAMKQGTEWGFACDGGDYWIFTGTNKDTVPDHRLLPGQENIKISLTDLGVTMTPASFTVIFNSYGIPYYPDWNTPLSAELPIDIKDAALNTRSFKILPETGLVK